MSYNIKFRKRAIQYHKEGSSIRATAKIFAVSPNTLNAWLQKYRNYEGKMSEDALLGYLGKIPDAYQSEVAKHFRSRQSTICRTMRRHNTTCKKRKEGTPKE